MAEKEPEFYMEIGFNTFDESPFRPTRIIYICGKNRTAGEFISRMSRVLADLISDDNLMRGVRDARLEVFNSEMDIIQGVFDSLLPESDEKEDQGVDS